MSTLKNNCTLAKIGEEYVIGYGGETFSVGTDQMKAHLLVIRINDAHKPNIRQDEEGLKICWNNHPKGVTCEYERVV